jgi:hypothetical protein
MAKKAFGTGGALETDDTVSGSAPDNANTKQELQGGKTSQLPRAYTPNQAADLLTGGRADKRNPSEFDQKALSEGMLVESEHTNNPTLAREIAMDHLAEDPMYYAKLRSIDPHHGKTAAYVLRGFLSKIAAATDAPTDLPGGEAVVGVGAATTGALAARESLRNVARERKAHAAVPKSPTLDALRDTLQPGDILFTRPQYSPRASFRVGGRKVKLPITGGDVIRMATASPHYHAALYIGEGNVVHSPGPGDVAQAARLEDLAHHSIEAYRPTAAAKSEVEHAVRFAGTAKGTPYYSMLETGLRGIQGMLGLGASPGNCKTGPEGRMHCTGLVAEAYPKHFERVTLTPEEMKSRAKMDLVARYSEIGEQTLKQRVLSRVVGPTLRKLKWGVGAGLATAGSIALANRLRLRGRDTE